jgi:hypothetical protein
MLSGMPYAVDIIVLNTCNEMSWFMIVFVWL